MDNITKVKKNKAINLTKKPLSGERGSLQSVGAEDEIRSTINEFEPLQTTLTKDVGQFVGLFCMSENMIFAPDCQQPRV